MVQAIQRLRRVASRGLAAGTAVTVVVLLTPVPAHAAEPVDLGTAANFSVLGATPVVSNTGPTTAEQDVGISPAASITGFQETDGGPGTAEGTFHAGDQVAADAQDDLTDAYNTAFNEPVDDTIATELGGEVITPGTYDTASGTFEITGELTLDAEGDDNAVFIFKTASTLVTASGSEITVINGSACVYWQVGSSATLGTGSQFIGNILAQTSITATTGVSIEGRLLARTGAVTLDTNTITESVCAADEPPAPPAPPDEPDGPDGPGGPGGPDLPVTGNGGGLVPMLTITGSALVLVGALLLVRYRRRPGTF